MQYCVVNSAIAYERLLRHSGLLVPLSMSTQLWQVANSAPLVQLPHLVCRVRTQLSVIDASTTAQSIKQMLAGNLDR